MTRDAFVLLTVGEIARANLRAVPVFADLGIGPRYLYWRLRDAVCELELDLGYVVRRLETALPAAAAA